MAVVNHLSRAASAMADLDEKIVRSDRAPDTPWYGVKQARPGAFAASIADAFARDIIAPPEGTRVTGFKEIRYTPEHLSDAEYDATIGFMADMFPNSRFIFNTRDGAEVARSGWWATLKRYTPADVKRIVRACDERFERSREQLGERAFIIDYAHYNGKPEGFLPLLEWLGEELPFERLEQICAKKLRHLQNQKPAPRPTMKSRLKKVLRS
jgi:hypothetical protein